MKTLLVMRHAKSSWNNARLADHDRPLNDRGRQDAPRMGALLKQNELTPDLIITSTAERALATAEAVALNSDYEGDIQYTRDFYHADPETILQVLQTVSDEYRQVMIVGHNPGMEALVEELTGSGEPFTTANVAVIDFDVASWGELTPQREGTLRALWRPKEI